MTQCMQAVKMLLQHNADMHAQDDWQGTPLAEAQAQPPDDSIKELLLKYDAVGQAPDVPEPSSTPSNPSHHHSGSDAVLRNTFSTDVVSHKNASVV